MNKVQYTHLKRILDDCLSPSKHTFCFGFAEAAHHLNLSDRELAKIFQVSVPTIDRWINHETAPHPIGRAPILKYLRTLLDERFAGK